MPKKQTKKLTPAERRAAKATHKEEKLRAQDALSQQQRHLQLQREIQYGSEAVRRHERQWKVMLERIALPNLRAQAEYAWHISEYILDSKDFTISLLLDELHQAEEQHQRSVKSQIDNYYRFVTLWRDQSTALWNGSSQEIELLYKAGTTERTDIVSSAKEHEDYLKTLLYMQDTQQKEVTKMQRGTHLAELEAENNRLLEETSKLTFDMENEYNDMFDSAQGFMNAYRDDLKVKKVHYDQLEAQDLENSRDIKTGWAQIERLYSKINSLKHELQEFEKLRSKHINDVITEWDDFNSLLKMLQKQVVDETAADHANLTHLTVVSNESLQVLQKVDDQGTKLLKLCELCRKLETAEEKILPFPVFSGPTPSMAPKKVATEMNLIRLDSRPRIIDRERDEVMDLPMRMEIFWNHVSKAEISRINITNEIACLCQENRALKESFYKYCDFYNCEPQVRMLYANSAVFK